MKTREDILALKDVVGIADSEIDGQPCIKVYLRSENTTTRSKLPDVIDGVAVHTEISGPLSAQ